MTLPPMKPLLLKFHRWIGILFALPLLVSSVLLFYGGVAFAYFIIFPVMFVFLTAATPTRLTVTGLAPISLAVGQLAFSAATISVTGLVKYTSCPRPT